MKIGIACDHRGYHLKLEIVEYLKKKKYDVLDVGTNSVIMVDYPMYAFALCSLVINKEVDFGIVICGTGIGMSIACNKVKGIRCAKVDNVKEAKHTREDNDANIIALNGTMPLFRVKDIIDTFIKSNFLEEERFIRRNEQISNFENMSYKKKFNINSLVTEKYKDNECGEII